MKLTFTRDFSWSPNVATTLRFAPGDVCEVTRECAAAAMAAGAAHETAGKGKPAPAEPSPISKE
jgi:hypothetical protein